MNIVEFAEYMHDPIWSEITSVRFDQNDLLLTFLVSDIEPQEEYFVQCKNVSKFQIGDVNTEWIIYDNECNESMMFGGSTITYVVWEDSVDWAPTVGRLVQEFGELPSFVDPYWIKETKKFQNYRLPLTIPVSKEAEFINLVQELKLNHSIHKQDQRNTVHFTLKLNDSSFIVAEEFIVKQIIKS